MKNEASFSRNKQKPKLIVSFNGAFRSRSGKIRYVGGESRIISVDRDVDFSELRSKISELSNISRCFTLTCRASDSDPLLLIATDDDVRLMIDIYGNDFSTSRLWIYVSNSDNDDNVRDLIDTNVKIMCDNYKSSDSVVDHVFVKNDFGDFSCSDARNEGFVSDKDKNHSSPPPLKDLDSPDAPLKYYLKDKFLDELYRLGEITKGYLSDNWDYSNSIQFPVSRKQPLDLKDDDLLVEIWDTSLDCLIGQVIGCNAKQELINYEPELKSKLNIENNVAKNYACNDTVKTRFPKVFNDIKSIGNSIRINRFRISGTRNRRVCSYHVKNRQNSLQHGKIRCGLKPSKNISKQGKYVRLYPRNYWEAGFISQTSPLEQKFNMDHGGDREAAAKLSSSHGIVTVGSGTNSTLERSMHNLSLSSSKLESPSRSCITSICVSQPKHNWRPFDDLMDEVRLSIISQKNRSIEVGKDEMNQDPSSGLSTEEKVNIKEEDKYLSKKEEEGDKHCKITGDKNVHGLAAITHLATKKLQTIKTADLEYIKELGSGTYGSVFYGKWRGSDVAIKKVKPGCCSDDPVVEDRVIKDFWKEAHMLGHLRHPNIVALYGVVTDGPPMNLAMVTEYMVNGSLKQVFNKKDRTIDRRKRLIIAMDAAFGMEYLHEKNIVHFDLKSHNLLVNMRDPHRPMCKIGDLGLAKIRQNNLLPGGVRGTIPWMAPELLDFKNNMVTEKIDVYSFGILMWELLTGEDPYSNLRSKEVIAGIIKGNLRPEIPNWCCPQWRSLMERCWSSDPTSRPSFSEIAKELRAMAAGMNIK